VQGAIFGSNHLDCIIILHAQNLSDQMSEVNKNDRLFIYTFLAANLSLHDVLNLWADRWRRQYARGDVIIVR